MYSKEQAAKLRQQFWTKFGQYMKPVPGADGEPVNWINYKTGKQGIHFHLDATNTNASVAIEIRHKDKTEREACYDQFLLMKKLLHNETGVEWYWEKEIMLDNSQPLCRISQALPQVNVMNETDWPGIITFLKSRIIALDSFWELVRDGFE